MSLRLAFPQWSCCVVLALALAGCNSSKTPEETTGAGSATKASAETTQADTLVQEAVVLIQQRQFSPAIEKLSTAIKTDPNFAEAYFQRAGILADAGQDRLALTDYGKAIELNAKDVRYHNMRGLFLLTRRQYETAVLDFNAAVQIDPKYIQAYNNRGLVHLAKSDFKAAVADFNQAVEIDPTYVDGFNNRGFAFYQGGVDDKALLDFNKTLELSPKYVNAFNNRAMLFMRVKKYREAVKDFTSAIELDEHNVKHYQNRRAAYLELGLRPQADADADHVAWLMKLNDLNMAVSKEPNAPKSYIQRAGHMAKGGHSEVALANFEQAIKIAPKSVEGYNGRAAYWLEQGDAAKAISDCNLAMQLQGRDGWNRQSISIRGDAFLKLGRLDEAIADFEAAERLDSAVAEAYYGRAKQRQKKGDSSGAQADLELARELDPSIGQ